MANIISFNSIDDDDSKEILTQFKESFRTRTNTDLDYVVRTPGRINIIGDHIDYHGFAVLPMAIQKSIWLGCSLDPRKDFSQINKLKIFNQESELYPDTICDHSFSYGPIIDRSHKWHHYVLCGYHGVLANKLLGVHASQILTHAKTLINDFGDDLKNQQDSWSSDSTLSGLPGFNILIRSDLPPASGLSSSSALVCASAVATHLMLCHQTKEDIQISREQLAEQCSKFEHLIGTQGGGMDQAVIMTANSGYAKHVEFMPCFACNDVQLPDNVVWLVSHCGLEYPKAATTGFNSRVLETKLGAAMIAKSLLPNHKELDIDLDNTITLGKVWQNLSSIYTQEQILLLLRDKVFSAVNLSLNEICLAIAMTEDELISKFGTSKAFLNENYKDQFPLLKRCEHVLEEAERVRKFKHVCETTQELKSLGSLMVASHISLKEKYECSHPALDNLVEIAIEAGALGARLTGAGWGGCTVTLVESSKSQNVYEKLACVSKFTFRTEPQSGCTIIKF